MTNKEYYWKTPKRYYSFTDYSINTYGFRFRKISVDAGFSCPNREGEQKTGGCTFCNNKAFSPSYCNSEKDIIVQINDGIKYYDKIRPHNDKFLIYFQTYTNTYAPFNELKLLYEKALEQPGVIGLAIATRPDCINNQIIDYLSELSQKYEIILEIGIESCYEETLERINRGHTFEQTVSILHQIAGKGIKTSGHLIFGLPGESREMMMYEAKVLSNLPLDFIKFHQLQIFKDTQIEKEFVKNPSNFIVFSAEEYIEFVVDFIERFNPKIVIERFFSEAPPRYLSSSPWKGLKSEKLISMLEKRLEERDTFQGKLFDR